MASLSPPKRHLSYRLVRRVPRSITNFYTLALAHSCKCNYRADDRDYGVYRSSHMLYTYKQAALEARSGVSTYNST